MDKRLIITIPHYNNFNGLVKTIQSINESFDIDIVITDDGSPEKLDETLITSSYKNNGNIFFQYLRSGGQCKWCNQDIAYLICCLCDGNFRSVKLYAIRIVLYHLQNTYIDGIFGSFI